MDVVLVSVLGGCVDVAPQPETVVDYLWFESTDCGSMPRSAYLANHNHEGC